MSDLEEWERLLDQLQEQNAATRRWVMLALSLSALAALILLAMALA